MTIKFGFVIQFAARWLSGIAQPSTIAQPAAPMRIEAAPAESQQVKPVMLLDPVPPLRRVPRLPRATFVVRGVGNWDSPPADLRPYLHPAAPEGGLLPETRR